MGLHAQATALLNFGDEDECYGIRLDPPPDDRGCSQGLAMMLHMMNESRIATGHNANTQAAAAYYFASQFATERIQGRPFGIKNAERVPIIKHEDVRRMLLDMKAHVEGIRAMVFKAFYYLDIQANSSDRARVRKFGVLAEILTPMVKCYGSETCLEIISQAIQILGGVGYTQEYPVEQYLRDSKILLIREGTSFIHGNDLVGRKMRKCYLRKTAAQESDSSASWLFRHEKILPLPRGIPLQNFFESSLHARIKFFVFSRSMAI